MQLDGFFMAENLKELYGFSSLHYVYAILTKVPSFFNEGI